jgi:hypothetical protein
MDYMNSWMYGSPRFSAGFRAEVDEFIKVTEKHTLTLTNNNGTIICPCVDCKNIMAFSDVSNIRSHLIMRDLFRTIQCEIIMVKQWLLMTTMMMIKDTMPKPSRF